MRGLIVAAGFSLVCSQAVGNSPAVETDIDPQQAIVTWLNEMENFKCRAVVTKVVRISSGRISEKTYNVECLCRNHILRIAQFSKGVIEGEQAWFDLRQSLVFPDGTAAEWRHPGLPGQLSFGNESADAARIRHVATETGDPLFALRKILRVISNRDISIVRQTTDETVIHAALGDAVEVREAGLLRDYIEISSSAQYGHLPTRMTRFCDTDNVERAYESGASLRIEYTRNHDGEIVPVKAERDARLKPDFRGLLAMKWEISDFRRTQPDIEEMKLVVPNQVLAVDCDEGRQVVVTDASDENFERVRKRLSNLVEVRPRREASRILASTFAGECPDLPEEVRQLRNTRPTSIAANSGGRRWGVVARPMPIYA